MVNHRNFNKDLMPVNYELRISWSRSDAICKRDYIILSAR
jgi:hypothetical protein